MSDQLLRRYRRRTDLADPRSPVHYPPDLELEPVHLDIDLHIDLATQTAEGVVTTTVLANGRDPRTLRLHAIDFEEVRVSDPDGNALTWQYDGDELTIRWEDPFTTGERRRVAVAYRVVEPADGLLFSRPSEAYPDETWFAATDHETERARHWLPCIDLPNVRTTLDFHLRAETRFTILANGYLVEETPHDDDTKTAHWRLEQRCPSYLLCFAIGDFVRADDGSFDDGEKVIDFAYFAGQAHSAEMLTLTFGRTGEMMAWMTKKLATPFPYPKYYQFALPQMGGAMENISLVSWGETLVLNEDNFPEFGFLIDQINVHEMAHSYFGDDIVSRDYAHAWLKESWATYIEQVYREDVDTPDVADFVYYSNASEYFEEADDSYKRPIVTRHFKSSWQMYDVHLYEGGACRLHTLRKELGDDLFWAAVQDYVQRYSGEVVETDHFRHVMEAHSGRSLGRFFDQWFYTAAYPDIDVSFDYDSDTQLGTFEIEQQQVDPDANIPAFVLKTSLSWTIDGQESRLPITLEQAKHAFTVRMESKPEMVRFDPDHAVLHKLSFNPGDGMLRTQLTDAPDIIGRIEAAKTLVKTGKRINLKAVADAYADEPFWGVRLEMFKALAQANHATAVSACAAIIATEQEPMILYQALQALDGLRDAEVRAALLERVEAGLPPLALASAYAQLGKQRPHAPVDLLLDAASRPSFNGFAQRGAFAGLAASRDERAIDPLLSHVVYGATPNNARWAAVGALADIGKGTEKVQRERISEVLIDLLRDPWLSVRMAAARGLVTLRATQALDALDAFATTLSEQDRVDVEELIEALRAVDRLDGSAVAKQVQDLRSQVRKLEDRLEKLSAKVDASDGE